MENFIIKPRRMAEADLPAHAQDGELIITTDSGKLFVGKGTGLPLRQVGGSDVSGKADITYVDAQDASTLSSAESYTDGKITAEVARANAAYDVSGAAATAQANAEAYTDGKIAAEVTRANAAYDASGAAAAAQSNAESYASGIVATETAARIAGDSLLQLKSEKGAASGYAPLDSNSLIPNAYLPPLAITKPNVVASQAAMLALTAEEGDVAIRTDINKNFILKAGGDPTVLADWLELLTPPAPVQSVNGYTGTVSLTSTDVTEGSNLYYRNVRVDARIAAASITESQVTGLVTDLAAKANASSLALVATSGAYDDLTGKPTLPSTLTNSTHKWLNSFNATTGAFTQTQPDFSDLSGTAATGQIPNLDASKITSGTLATAQSGVADVTAVGSGDLWGFTVFPPPASLINSNTSGAGQNGKVELWRMVVPFKFSVRSMRFLVAALAGQTFDFGLYDASGNLLCHTGSTAGTGTLVTFTVSPAVTISPGVYYLGATFSGNFTYNVIQQGTNAAAMQGYFKATNGAVSGALPSTTGVLTQVFDTALYPPAVIFVS